MNLPKKLGLVALLTLGGILVTLFLLFIVFPIVVLPLYTTISHESNEEEYQYRYTQFLKSENRTERGFVTILEKLKPDEFLFYEKEDHYALISIFGSPEYQCSGSCYCEADDDERRMVSKVASTVVQGLFYILASGSSIVAYQKAKEYFGEECKNKFSDKCPGSSIRSKVTTCDGIDHSTLSEEDGEALKRDTIGKWVYRCFGSCLTNRNLVKPEDIEFARKYECHKLRNEGNIIPLIDFDKMDLSKYTYPELFNMEYEDCLKNFQLFKLSTFCKESSKPIIPLDLTRVRMDDRLNAVSYCSGDPKDGGINPTVFCVRQDRWPSEWE